MRGGGLDSFCRLAQNGTISGDVLKKKQATKGKEKETASPVASHNVKICKREETAGEGQAFRGRRLP